MTLAVLDQWLAAAFNDDTRDNATSRARDDTHRPNVAAEPLYKAERACLRHLQTGDTNALRELVDRHAATLARIAYTYVRSRDTAQDIVQDIFIALWERRATLDIHGSIENYLTRAVRNRALNLVRANQRATRRAETYANDLTPAENTAVSALDAADELAVFNAAIAVLPPRQREVFRLRHEHELSYEAIAELLGIGIPSVHNLMSKAVRRLYETFSTRDQETSPDR